MYIIHTHLLIINNTSYNTVSNELSGGRSAAMGGWALIGVDRSVEDDSSTT